MALTIWQKLVVCAVIMLGLATAVIAIDQALELNDFVKADVLRVEGDTIVLGTGCRAIIADTSTERADSIRLGLQKKIDERPNTHDTFVQALKTFNITVERFTLSRFEGQLYYSELLLRGPNKALKLDVRPSDGMAIAVRVDAPMYINRTLLEETGRDIC